VAKHPKVAERMAVGLPHERWGEAVAVFVVPNTGTSIEEQEIVAYCREGLAGYKVPKRAIMLGEIPKNPSGKILKRDLRAQYRALYAE
jgi:fatty-acyl-CoA synthase